MGKQTTSKMKKKAWSVFSKYIRLRDCLETTGTIGFGKCVTCGTRYPFKELQAGHILDGRTGMQFLDERGVFAQCYACNVCKHGNKEIFVPWFLDTFGRKLYRTLQRLKRTPCLWKIPDYEKFIEETEKHIKQLQKGLV